MRSAGQLDANGDGRLTYAPSCCLLDVFACTVVSDDEVILDIGARSYCRDVVWRPVADHCDGDGGV
jgi:hypothetical protein